MKFFCPAKINLFLKIVGKTPDNYHKLESLFAFLDLSDELEVEKSDNFQLEILGEFSSLIDQSNNLFTKILDFFVQEFGISRSLQIKITKNIPVGAGMGGGSSNAAFFMKALNKIFFLNLSKPELQKISLNFGSDIAFFFEERSAIVRGRGEIITEFQSFAPIYTLLVNPKIHLSTKEVFQKFSQKFSSEFLPQELLKKDVVELIKNFPNDLTESAISIVPVIKDILIELKNCGAEIAKMSGSGATCFGIFSSEESLKIAKAQLVKNHPEFFVVRAKILSHV